MIEPINYLNANLIEDWIKNNKPDPVTAKSVCDEFINRVKIKGREEFTLKTKELIEKTSRLASGITILRRMLNTEKDFLLIEGDENKYHFNDSQEISEIYLSFQKTKSFGVTRNHERDPELMKMSKTSTFIHECLHAWHFNQDPPIVKEERLKGESFWPEMDNQEEELTITGNLHIVGKNPDFCCENTARIELGQPCRINHKGVILKKDEPLSLHHMVSVRALANVKKALIDHPEAHFYSEYVPKYKDQTPLDMALFLRAQEVNAGIQKEWLELIKLLINAGFKSNYSYKIAILENSVEVLKLLIEANIPPSEDILKLAVEKDSYKAVDELLALLTKGGYIPPNPSKDFTQSEIVIPEVKLQILFSRYKKALAIFNQKFPSSKETSLDVVQLLLQAGAKPSEEVLKITSRQNSLEVIKLFINTGWKPSSATWEFAIEHYHSKTVQFFIESGFEPPKKALEIAIKARDAEMVTLLIHGGKMKLYESLLILAAQMGNSEMVELLIQEGLEVSKELLEQARKEKGHPHRLLENFMTN